MEQKIKDKLWKEGKSAKDYPKDWIVIPVLEVIEILNTETITNTKSK